ncbi:LHFPL tetraspan subfamily member 6 protein-like isoform X2 [Diaphorina citri]|uniref:LHFPL tetraspan subfamily member 6 protein-like isoform X2 n=1 Tax=Diaphorina citri TaxID=121845 RepID=A0A3Q0JBW5_DIACI|nr:LHFPL tetraspan subfamily member 6 protein-like isoform X2 [Diaphorina citri]
MAGDLTNVGILWALLSLVAAVLCCSGFYIPFWVQGQNPEGQQIHFNSFRRCGMPVTFVETPRVGDRCFRYESFKDIPSGWWQLTTIFVGFGGTVAMIIAITAMSACCISYVVQKSTAKVAGGVQLFAALMISIGVAVYPLGWDNPEMKEACGGLSSPYKLGSCDLSWSIWLLVAAILVLITCTFLSIFAAKVSPDQISY